MTTKNWETSSSISARFHHLLGTDNAENHVRGERAIWRAVILQALEDAASRSKKVKDKFNKDQAIHWLTHKNADFDHVCDLAGFEPSYVRRKVKRALQNGCQWRKRPEPTPRKSKRAPSSSASKKPKHQAEIIDLKQFRETLSLAS